MNVNALLILGTAAIAVAGCASPGERYYSLMPDAPRIAHSEVQPARTLTVAAVTVPEAVDRPQLVIETGDQQRVVLEQERWIEPVAGGLQRALAQQLALALPDTAVLLGGDPGAAAAADQVHVQVRRLEMNLESGARLDAHWQIVDRSGAMRREEDFSIGVAAAGRSYAALVRAQSGAVRELAGRIVAALQGLAAAPADGAR